MAGGGVRGRKRRGKEEKGHKYAYTKMEASATELGDCVPGVYGLQFF
jgi:hypothetical protein